MLHIITDSMATSDRELMPPPSSQYPSSQSPSSLSARVWECSDSTAFSEATKLETKRLSGPGCWACNTEHTQICHVVPKDDPQAVIWEQAGVFTLSYKSTSNAIPLCPTCHSAYDLAIDPGYVFFPTDLKFFIEFEIEDRERRRIAAEIGQPQSIQRRVPPAIEYEARQRETGVLSSEATSIGGLYRRVFLRNFLLGGLRPELLRSLATHKQWHGNPIASFRRAMAALGSPRLLVMDVTIRNDLQRLRDLYFEDEFQKPAHALLRDIYGADDSRDNKRHLEEQDEDEITAKKFKHQEIEPRVDNTERIVPTSQLRMCPGREDWVLGPNNTANMEVDRFAPLFLPV